MICGRQVTACRGATRVRERAGAHKYLRIRASRNGGAETEGCFEPVDCRGGTQRACFVWGELGYAKEYHVERYLREIRHHELAPVSREMIWNCVAENVL